jgi:uncharacterized protein
MVTRRNFIRNTGIGVAGITLAGYGSLFASDSISPFERYTSLRPAFPDRKFRSAAVDTLIESVKKDIADPELAWLFENCFPNTLDTTVSYAETAGRPDTFVITGDIHAMWLRDSSAQVWPYLPLTRGDEPLRKLIAGVINRQALCILKDPYANAFLQGDEISEWKSDITDMKPGLHERKWEVDSLCYPIRLAYHYWKTTGDTSVFDQSWNKAAELILSTFRVQQRIDGPGPYTFKRVTSWYTDNVPCNGAGNPVKPTGLICSTFRPSDDATTFLFLIPSNYFAMVSLRQLAEISESVTRNKSLAFGCRKLAGEVERALRIYAATDHQHYGRLLSYEVDGFGNRLMMDDSNVPTLLSMPYLGCLENSDPLYQNTRNFILSEDNPWYFSGKAASGIGSPHTLPGKIWPMTLIMQALTSTKPEEIRNCLRMLRNTHGGTGFMHESFNKDDPKDYTRSWFAWANTLFGELILKVHKEHPEILAEKF